MNIFLDYVPPLFVHMMAWTYTTKSNTSVISGCSLLFCVYTQILLSLKFMIAISNEIMLGSWEALECTKYLSALSAIRL